ncbi:MAG: peptidoglycan recognition protein [Desulfobacteraceae bacterium]|nr:peptidoglycan recognition protein [Desulfobacteraceae bacterium]
MKKLFFIIVCLACSSNLFAENIPVISETVNYNFLGENNFSAFKHSARNKSNKKFTSEIIKANVPFAHVGVSWSANIYERTEIFIDIRTSKNSVSWTEWKQVTIETYPDETQKHRFFGGLISSGSNDRIHQYIQYSVTLIPNHDMIYPSLNDISLTYIDPGVTPPDLRKKISDARKTTRSYSKPNVVSRAGWGADESILSWSPQYQPVTHMIIHHTAGSNTAVNNDWASVVRSIYVYHAKTKGWGDIGYNFLVDPDGVLYEGRYGGDDVTAGHAYPYNHGTLGFSFMGTYTDVSPSNQMLASSKRLLAWKCDQKNTDPSGSSPVLYDNTIRPNIMGHRNVSATACPGNILYNLLPQIRNDVVSLIRGSYVLLNVYDFWRCAYPICADPDANNWNQNFDAQYKIENIGSESVYIDKLALAVHYSDNSFWFDLKEKNSGISKFYYNITLDPGDIFHFGQAFGYFTKPGNYKIVAKAYFNDQWNELATQDITITDCGLR